MPPKTAIGNWEHTVIQSTKWNLNSSPNQLHKKFSATSLIDLTNEMEY